MKDFHNWCADMQETYEDPNDYMNACISTAASPPREPTRWQIRSYMATLVVGKPFGEESVQTWMEVFCTHYNYLAEELATDITYTLGSAIAKSYYETEGDIESLLWWHNFNESIMNNTFSLGDN